MSKIRLFVVDDHELFRTGLMYSLEVSPDIEVVDEASSGDELLKKLHAVSADILLLDMSMPGQCGNNLIAQIKEIYPGIRILVVSGNNKAQVAFHALKAGASGYIAKDCSPQTLLGAIKQIAATGSYLSPQMEKQMKAAHCPFCQLSPRKLEAAKLWGDGLSHKDIALQLDITPETVRSHVRQVYDKLDIKSRAELIQLISSSWHFS